MPNTVIALKKSATPSAAPASLANGELAINYADGKLFYKHANGTIAAIQSGSGSASDSFGTVNAAGTLIIADTAGDILTLESGSGITITGDSVNDKITIASTVDISPAFAQANTARDTANTSGTNAVNAFGKANTALANTSGVSFNGNLHFPTGNIGIGTASPASPTKLDVRGVIQGQSYALPNDLGSAQWVKLGTLTIPQGGYTARIRMYMHQGYNALNTQDFYTDIFFKTSNASSVDGNGFSGNSWYYSHGFNLANITPKWVGNVAGVSASAYDLYISVPAYIQNSHYIVEIVEGVNWTHVGTIGQVDPGSGSSTVCVSSVGYNITLGNVGIGRTDPGYKLDIVGTANVSNMLVNGNMVFTTANDGTGSNLDADLLDGQHGSYYGIATDVTASFTKANAAPDIANSYTQTVGAAANGWANTISNTRALASNAYAESIGTAGNVYARAVGTAGNVYAREVGTAGNAYTQTVGTAGNTWANTISNTRALASNAYAESIGTAGNVYAREVGTAGNTYAREVGTAGNSYTITVGTAANGWSNTVGADAKGYANSNFVKLTAASQTITGNLNIVGDLTLSGNTFVIDATRLEVDDPLIYLAANNYTSDLVDIGFIANYNNGSANLYTGLYREHADKMYYLFNGYDKEPANNHIGALSNNMTLAVLNADLRTSNLFLGGANAILTIGAAFDKANAALPSSSYTASDVLTKLLTVDGAASGLDADLLDGQQGSYYNHRNYTDATNYLGGYYVSGGSELPSNTVFGAGKLKLAMISGTTLGFGGTWNDVLWLSSYNGGDVKTSAALVIDKTGGTDNIYFSRQPYDSATWGTGRKLWHDGNDGSASGLDADLLDGQQGTYYGIATDVTASFTKANTSGTDAVNAFAKANTACTKSDTAQTTAVSAFGQANTAQTTAVSAFGQANTACTKSDTAQTTAVAAFTKANTAGTDATNAFAKANTSGTDAVNAFAKANTACTKADTAQTTAVAAFASANIALSYRGTITETTSGDNTSNTVRTTGVYTVNYPGASDALIDIGGIGGSSPRIQMRFNYSDEIYFRVARDSEVNFDAAGPFSNRIWHSSNDGAASGLDADLLDGQHGSFYSTDTKATAAFAQANTALTTGQAAFAQANSRVSSVSGTGTVSGISLSGTVTSSGSLTLGGTLSASVIDNMTDEHRLFNNMGDNHATRTAFDATNPSYNFGWRFVQGSTNGPGTGSQYYSEYVGLGNDYLATGATSYGMQIAYPRNVTEPYIAIRYNENNTLGAWQKISAGNSDKLNGQASTFYSTDAKATAAFATANAALSSSSYTASDVLSKLLTVDGSGSGLDADLLDGLSSASFMRTDAASTHTTGKLTVYTPAGAVGTVSGTDNLEVFQPTTGTDAFLTFHISGDYAANFGIDGTTNDLFYGGWSAGANKFKVWHAGNDGASSGLDADLLDGQHGSFYATDAKATAAFDKANTAGGGATLFTDSVNATRYIVFDDATSGSFTQANVSTSLTFNPSTGTLSSTIFNSTSDETLKYDVEIVENALSFIDDMNGVRFKWKRNDEPSLGVIAQDIEKILPELVASDGDHKTVNYNGIIAVLIQAIKELKTEVDDLKHKYRKLEK